MNLKIDMSREMFTVAESPEAPAVAGIWGRATCFSRFVVDNNDIIPLTDECGFHGLLIKAKNGGYGGDSEKC